MSDADPRPRRGRSTFLERKTYRRARLEDAARLLPVLGLFLLLSPTAIRSTGGGSGLWLIYFMGVWLLLIVAAAVLSRALARTSQDQGQGGA
ncbi:MAG: hypothetical protein AAGF88_08115 [Pseudomonadota bacterium]